MKRLAISLMTLAAGGLVSQTASAELWNATDTVPRPNAILGYDTSVTMRIDVGCNSCHRRGLPSHLERVTIAREDILDTMPLFQDYFVFGGFEYQGCGSAHIRARTMPNVADPNASYTATRNLLQNARGCNRSERTFPSGSTTLCITPTPYCIGDPPVADSILRGGLNGLTLPPLPAATSTVCGNPARVAPTFDLQAFLLSQTAGMQWPRWDAANITGAQVHNDLCDPLNAVLQSARTALNRCLVDPAAYWDLSILGGGVGTWCTPGTIANNACTTSPFVGTCVCDASNPQCHFGGTRTSECGLPLSWKTRQQVAVCESYDPNTFGDAFSSQPDNRINVGGCRENVAMFFTDGYQGHRSGVQLEANQAQLTYGSASGQPNMFVFRISNSFRGEADRMMRYVSAGQLSNAFLATDEDQMRTSFSQVLARIYRGDYAGTGLSTSPSGDRVAITSFVVPGYAPGAPVDDTYIGWPQRIAFHPVDEHGVIDPNPTFQTDWQSKVQGTSACGYHELGGTLPSLIGPGDRFDNNVARNVTIPVGSLGDRDSDGTPEPTQALRWGRAYGFGATKPIIVEAPSEAPNPEWGAAWGDHVTAVGTRPRMVYTWSNGYLLGFHAGNHDGNGTFGATHLQNSYDDSVGAAGTEVLRYLPDWMQPNAQNGHGPQFDLTLNPLVPQRLTTGEMVAREVWMDMGGPAGEFRTVLLAAQGKEGAGYAALDITDPCNPSVLWDELLPAGAYASARPEVYYIPASGAPEQRAAAVTTGGLDGLPIIIAFDLRNGNELSRMGLPAVANTSYPSAPVCVDVTGEGVVTHCYALRSDGYLARVELDLAGGGFVSVENITPTSGGTPVTTGGGRVFSTEPAVFFGPDGAVNLVFGSGSHRDLTVAGPNNYVYKVVDESTRRQGIPSGAATTDGACAPNGGGSTSGVFPLPAGDRMVSPPVIADGVVAWAAYHTSSTGCVAGTGSLYAMRYDTCEDALGSGTTRPQPTPLGPGIPTSPSIHTPSGTVLARTSAGSDADGVGAFSADTTGPGRPWARKLWWRYELDVR